MSDTISHSSSPAIQRWPEFRTLVRWIVHSWFRSADSEMRWEQ